MTARASLSLLITLRGTGRSTIAAKKGARLGKRSLQTTKKRSIESHSCLELSNLRYSAQERAVKPALPYSVSNKEVRYCLETCPDICPVLPETCPDICPILPEYCPILPERCPILPGYCPILPGYCPILPVNNYVIVFLSRPWWTYE